MSITAAIEVWPGYERLFWKCGHSRVFSVYRLIDRRMPCPECGAEVTTPPKAIPLSIVNGVLKLRWVVCGHTAKVDCNVFSFKQYIADVQHRPCPVCPGVEADLRKEAIRLKKQAQRRARQLAGVAAVRYRLAQAEERHQRELEAVKRRERQRERNRQYAARSAQRALFGSDPTCSLKEAAPPWCESWWHPRPWEWELIGEEC